MCVRSQLHVEYWMFGQKDLPLRQWLHSSEIPGWIRCLEVCYEEKTKYPWAAQTFRPTWYFHLFHLFLPFGKEEVFKGIGQLRPHSVKLPGRSMLARHRQSDRQHLEQGSHSQLPGALWRTGILQTQRHSQGLMMTEGRRCIKWKWCKTEQGCMVQSLKTNMTTKIENWEDTRHFKWANKNNTHNISCCRFKQQICSGRLRLKRN